jgi:hypothetical protein
MEDVMSDRLKLWFMLGVLAAGLFAIFLERAPAQNKNSSTVTPADYLKWRNEFKNWGRWGALPKKALAQSGSSKTVSSSPWRTPSRKKLTPKFPTAASFIA